MNRRELIKSLLGTVASYSLLETLFTRDALAGPVKPAAAVWVRELDAMSRDLKGERITPVQWQAKVQELLPVEEALRKYGHEDHHGEMRGSTPG